MSFIRCVAGLQGQGLLKKSDLEQIEKFYNSELEKNTKIAGGPDAAKLATEIATERFGKLIATRRRNAAIHIKKTRQLVEWMGDLTDSKSKIHGLVQKAWITQKSIAELHRNVARDFMFEYAPSFMGTKGKTEGLDDIIRAMMGENVTNKAAVTHATNLRKMFNTIHKDYTAKGGVLDFIDDYMPVMWMEDKIKAVDKDAFIRDMHEHVRADRVDADKVEDFYSSIFDTLSSNGLNKRKAKLDSFKAGESKQLAGKAKTFPERKNYQKKIYFKNADSYIAMMEKYGFGKNEFYGTVNSYIDRMAMDIGTLSTFGPRIDDIKKTVKTLNGLTRSNGGKNVFDNTVDGYFDLLKGVQYSRDADTWYSKGLNVVMPLTRSALMGSAVISAFGDAAFVASTKRLNGLGHVSAMKSIFQSFNPFEDKDQLKNLAYISDMANRSLISETDRFSGFKGKADVMTNAVINVSGLGKWTDNMAESASKMLHGNVFANRKSAFKDLDPQFRSSAKEWDITAGDWDKIRNTRPYQDQLNNGTVIRPIDVAKQHDSDLAVKMLNWEKSIRLQATNEPGIKTVLATSGAGLGNVRQNSPASLFSRSVFMLKAFPLTVVQNHLTGSITKLGKAKGVANILGTILTATSLYMMSKQARNLLAGKTLQDWDDPKFVGESIIGSGGLGLFGDLVFRNYNSFNTTMLGELQGPLFALAEQSVAAASSNTVKLFQGKDTKLGSDLTKIGRRLTPGQNLWFTNAFVNYFFDWMDDQLDSDNYDKRQKRLNESMKDKGQEFFFKYGE